MTKLATDPFITPGHKAGPTFVATCWTWWERGRCACSCECFARVDGDETGPARCGACAIARDQVRHQRPAADEVEVVREAETAGQPDDGDRLLCRGDPSSYTLDLDRLEALALDATRGPWGAERDARGAECGRACSPDGCFGHPIRGVAYLEGPDLGSEDSSRGDRRALAWVRDGATCEPFPMLTRDAEFIAAFHPGVALALVRAARKNMPPAVGTPSGALADRSHGAAQAAEPTAGGSP